MNSVLAHIENTPQETQRLVGLKYEQLKQLITQAQLIKNQKQAEVESNQIRIIAKGGGRQPKLSETEQLLLTLVGCGCNLM